MYTFFPVSLFVVLSLGYKTPEISSTPVKPTLFTGAFHEWGRLTKILYLFAWIELANSAPKMQGIERHLHISTIATRLLRQRGKRGKNRKGVSACLDIQLGLIAQWGKGRVGVYTTSPR